MNLQSILDWSVALSQAAGEIAREYYQQSFLTHWKTDASPVTDADLAIERFLRQAIVKQYPEHDILGEEAGQTSTNSDYLWILDPIDGTRSFARGLPVFGIQMALCYLQKPILGVIHFPVLHETIYAADGLGCFWNGKTCRVSEIDEPTRSLIYVHERNLARERSPALNSWLQLFPVERNWGDCYSFVQVITGRAEFAIDPRMQVWDSAPLPVLVQEAGGVFLDWNGENTIWTGSAIVSNQRFVEQIRDIILHKINPVL